MAGAALCGGFADAIWALTVTEIEIDPLESRAGPMTARIVRDVTCDPTRRRAAFGAFFDLDVHMPE
jgi:hypothetical protein